MNEAKTVPAVHDFDNCGEGWKCVCGPTLYRTFGDLYRHMLESLQDAVRRLTEERDCVSRLRDSWLLAFHDAQAQLVRTIEERDRLDAERRHWAGVRQEGRMLLATAAVDHRTLMETRDPAVAVRWAIQHIEDDFRSFLTSSRAALSGESSPTVLGIPVKEDAAMAPDEVRLVSGDQTMTMKLPGEFRIPDYAKYEALVAEYRGVTSELVRLIDPLPEETRERVYAWRTARDRAAADHILPGKDVPADHGP